MATLPIEQTFVSVREYLATSYSPDREYVDGQIVERNLGEKEHSLLQKYFTILFGLQEEAWGVAVYPGLRTHVAATILRVPDVLVVSAGMEFDRILEVPPLISIKILSPEDKWSDVVKKTEEYVAFGIENIWIVDPIRRRAWTADSRGLHPVNDGTLSVSETPIRIVLSEAFAKLD